MERFYMIFNKNLLELVEQFIGKNEEMRTIHTDLKFVCKNFKEKPLELFEEMIYNQYKTKLINHEEEFFLTLNDDFDEHTKKYIDFFKNIWGITDTTEKENVWKYIDIMIKIIEKIKC